MTSWRAGLDRASRRVARMTRMWSAYSSRSTTVRIERRIVASSSADLEEPRVVGPREVARDVEVEQRAQVAALVGDPGDEHVHRVPVALLAGGRDVGDDDDAVDALADLLGEVLDRGSRGSGRCSSPWAKTSCMSDRRDAVPRRSSALAGSPWIATNSSRPLGRTTSIAHTRKPVRVAASRARACMSARARASPQLRSRVLRSPVRTCSMASRPPTATWIVGGRWWAPDRFAQVVACAVDELVPGRRRVSAPRAGRRPAATR